MDFVPNLKCVTFGNKFNQDTMEIKNLINLEKITFRNKFNCVLQCGLLSLLNLEKVTFSDTYHIKTYNFRRKI